MVFKIKVSKCKLPFIIIPYHIIGIASILFNFTLYVYPNSKFQYFCLKEIFVVFWLKFMSNQTFHKLQVGGFIAIFKIQYSGKFIIFGTNIGINSYFICSDNVTYYYDKEVAMCVVGKIILFRHSYTQRLVFCIFI